jgi:hypothetical protein
VHEDPKDIWADDKFGRRQEAENIIAYLESVTSRPKLRVDHAGHVLAIDAGYGQGKTFFLKRLKTQLSINHPVAYVDAWADDLQNEPLVAIMATLQDALAPYKSEEVQAKLLKLNSTAAKVSKIIATGLLKKGVSLFITEGATNLLTNELAGDSSVIDKDAISDTVSETVADLAALSIPESEFRKKIGVYREGVKAVIEMRRSLEAVVASLPSAKTKLPIIIIIDELDRCRPSYAVKLMEEVKHLFDASGVVFILGTHHRQLAHSVSGLYGRGFDGEAYLRRFFDRQYFLEVPKLHDLVRHTAETLNLDASRLEAPNVVEPSSRPRQIDPLELIVLHLEAVQIPARDVLRVMESLDLCLSLTEQKKLFTPFLLPKILSHVCGRGLEAGQFSWYYWAPKQPESGYRGNAEYIAYHPAKLFEALQAASITPYRELNATPYEQLSYAQSLILYDNPGVAPAPYYTLPGYERLVSAVARFSGQTPI